MSLEDHVAIDIDETAFGSGTMIPIGGGYTPR